MTPSAFFVSLAGKMHVVRGSPLLVLFLVAAAGYVAGTIELAGFSLGLVLGRLGRTGRLVWTLPFSAISSSRGAAHAPARRS